MRALKRRLTALGDTCAESSIAGRLIELARGDQATPAGGVFGAASLPADAVRAAARSRRASPAPRLEDRDRIGDERAARDRRHRVPARERVRAAARAEGRPFRGQLPAAAQLRRRPGARRGHDARGRDGGREPRQHVVLAAGHAGQARPAQAGNRAAGPARRAGRDGGRDHASGSARRVGQRRSVARSLRYRQPRLVRPSLTEPLAAPSTFGEPQREVGPMLWLYWRRSRLVIGVTAVAVGALTGLALARGLARGRRHPDRAACRDRPVRRTSRGTPCPRLTIPRCVAACC